MSRTFISLSLLSLAACSGSGSPENNSKKKAVPSSHTHTAAKNSKSSNSTGMPTVKPEAPKPAVPSAPALAIPEGARLVTVNGNDAMQFDTKEIRVKAGEKIALTLNHTGKLPKTAMGHNLVILAVGTDLSTFATAAIAAAAEDYVPKSQMDSIIAATQLIGGGESDTVVFDAPAVGTYDFLCSFPGHYAIMKGKFIVE